MNKKNFSIPSLLNALVSGESLFFSGLFFWALLFLIYLPAANAGRVGDFPGWVHFLNSVNFVDYLNRSESGIPSMYQFTQLVTYMFYKMFGANAWMWHLLFITLHSANALLLFVFFRRLFLNSLVKNAGLVAFVGVVLFCVCPHVSEVIVWEPAFHYLLGFLLMLAVLYYTQRYLITGNQKYGWYAGILFFLSSYSLEVFYLTPLFTLTLACYYFIVLKTDKKTFFKTLQYFLFPQVLFFSLNILLLRLRYHEGVAHITANSIQFNGSTFSKAAKYVFHIVFLGRYFPTDLKNRIYQFFESGKGLFVFYGLFSVATLYILYSFRKMKNSGKAAVLLFIWTVFSIGLIMPLWFPERGLVILDRYLYVPCAIVYIFLAVFLNNIFNKYVFISFFVLYALINLRFTHKVNAYWQQSAHVVNNLVYNFPNDTTKKVLLLNLPECLDGVQMIGSRTEGEFGMMYDAIMPHKLANKVYDVEAYYLESPADGANVMVMNDSTARVTLNQWGTWWLFYGFGATSYVNDDGSFRVDMKDEGRFFDVILRRPANEYLLLYQVGDQWKKVDWGKKGVVQE